MCSHEHVDQKELPDQYIPTPQERTEAVKRGYKTIFGPEGPQSDYFQEKPWGPFLDLPSEIRLGIYKQMRILELIARAENAHRPHKQGILPYMGI
jgi:hypothetical protein